MSAGRRGWTYLASDSGRASLRPEIGTQFWIHLKPTLASVFIDYWFGRITLTQNRFSRRKRKDLNLLLMMRQI